MLSAILTDQRSHEKPARKCSTSSINSLSYRHLWFILETDIVDDIPDFIHYTVQKISYWHLIVTSGFTN